MTKIDELPDEWRARAASVNDQSSPTLLVDCAEELEAAIEGHEYELLEAEQKGANAELEQLRVRLQTASAVIDRLETIVRSTDFKDIYSEALEIGKSFGAPALVHAASDLAFARAAIQRLESMADVFERFVAAMAAEKNRTCNCPERMLEVLRALP